jgi:predicted transcriptional regulator of viral defense system
MRSLEFFETHPVFLHAEYLAARATRGRSVRTSNNLLAQHLAAGRLVRVRRGLYATVPRGVDPDRATVDPYLVCSHAADDAVVAYHAALQFFGKAHSVWRRFHYLTRNRARPFVFRGLEFVAVQAPTAVRSQAEWGGGVVAVEHAGGLVRVRTLEHTLVDLLDVPARGGGWEEIWRSLEMVEYFDLEAVVAYALALGSALTVARVGFCLEQHRESWMVEETHLDALRAHAPGQPRYLDSTRQPGRLVSGWNLIVPEYVLHRGWEESS